MPFDFKSYKTKCEELSSEELQIEWQKYTREISSGATMTSTSAGFVPFTAGISSIGLVVSIPQMINAKKKMKIIDAELQNRGIAHHTRKRDVAVSVATAGSVGVLSFGLAPYGADALGAAAGEKGIEYVVSHAAVDAVGATAEHKHSKDLKIKALNKLTKEHARYCVCGTENSVEYYSCYSCGSQMGQGYCVCGTKNPVEASFCFSCGRQMGQGYF
jgi:hypothetical protein